MQMDEQSPFMRHALADNMAKQITANIDPFDRDALLLWKAYVKRIKPVPQPVMVAAVQSFWVMSGTVGILIEDGDDQALVMDKAGDLLWNALDESARREWLLKAV
jgi:hypothetical protein